MLKLHCCGQQSLCCWDNSQGTRQTVWIPSNASKENTVCSFEIASNSAHEYAFHTAFPKRVMFYTAEDSNYLYFESDETDGSVCEMKVDKNEVWDTAQGMQRLEVDYFYTENTTSDWLEWRRQGTNLCLVDTSYSLPVVDSACIFQVFKSGGMPSIWTTSKSSLDFNIKLTTPDDGVVFDSVVSASIGTNIQAGRWYYYGDYTAPTGYTATTGTIPVGMKNYLASIRLIAGQGNASFNARSVLITCNNGSGASQTSSFWIGDYNPRSNQLNEGNTLTRNFFSNTFTVEITEQ